LISKSASDIFKCNKIYYAAYNNKWYTLNSKTIEDLLLLMTRGSKSVYLTAGKVSPVTMTTFCSVSLILFWILRYWYH